MDFWKPPSSEEARESLGYSIPVLASLLKSRNSGSKNASSFHITDLVITIISELERNRYKTPIFI